MSLYFPMFFDLSSRNVLFIGGGEIAARRVAAMLDFAGSVTVVAPEAHPAIQALAAEGRITLRSRRFSGDDLDGADIVLAATGNADTDKEIAEMCRRRGMLFNAASDASLCDFYFPGIVKRGPLVIGVSSSGEDHGLASETTQYLKGIFEKNGQSD